MMTLGKCVFVGKDGVNIDGECHCQNDATEIFKGKKKTWAVCKEHYSKMAGFLAMVKTALGEKKHPDGYA